MLNKISITSLTNGMGLGGMAREIVTINKNLNKEFFSHFVISMRLKDDARSKFIDNNKFFLF